MMGFSGYGYDQSAWMAIPMGITLLVVLGLVVWAVVAIVRATTPDKQAHLPRVTGGGEEADAILAGRFARGEMTAEEFTAARLVLHGSAPPRV